MSENNKIFRQKSLDRISSPEDLDRYIKTTSPSLWILLIAVIIFLCGIIVWAVEGKLETSSTVGCQIENGTVSCYIKESDYELISEESYIQIEDEKIAIVSVSKMMEADETSDNALLHNSSIETGEWYYIITGKCNLSNNEVKAKVVYETISAIQFIFN